MRSLLNIVFVCVDEGTSGRIELHFRLLNLSNVVIVVCVDEGTIQLF